jgi:hypothetical protein
VETDGPRVLDANHRRPLDAKLDPAQRAAGHAISDNARVTRHREPVAKGQSEPPVARNRKCGKRPQRLWRGRRASAAKILRQFALLQLIVGVLGRPCGSEN